MSKNQSLIEIEPVMHRMRSRGFAHNARSQGRSTPETCHFELSKTVRLNKQAARSDLGRLGFKGMAGQQKNAQANHLTRAFKRDLSLVLAWLSLTGLHPCRARFCFTRPFQHNRNDVNAYQPNPITGSRRRDNNQT